MEAAARENGKFVALADAADVGARQHEGFARLRVGDGVDAADLRALLVGGDEVFLILGFHLWFAPCPARGFLFRVCAHRQGYYTSVMVAVGSTVRGVGGDYSY